MNEGSFETLTNAELEGGDYSQSSFSVREYWEGQLADVPALELPTDCPRPAALGRAMGVESCGLERELSEGLRRLGRDADVNVNGNVETVGLAIFAVLLGVDQQVQHSMRDAAWRSPSHIGPDDALFHGID